MLNLSLSDIPVAMVFATHRIIRDCNSEFADLFGYAREDIIDSSFARLYPAVADFIQTGRLWRLHLKGGAVYHDERIMAGEGGKPFWCRVNGRSQDPGDPFAAALYCFTPMSRPVTDSTRKLTGRQRQILTMVAQGKTNTVIAIETGLSPRTVEAHRLRMARSAGVQNSAELVAWFLSQPQSERTVSFVSRAGASA